MHGAMVHVTLATTSVSQKAVQCCSGLTLCAPCRGERLNVSIGGMQTRMQQWICDDAVDSENQAEHNDAEKTNCSSFRPVWSNGRCGVTNKRLRSSHHRFPGFLSTSGSTVSLILRFCNHIQSHNKFIKFNIIWIPSELNSCAVNHVVNNYNWPM